MLIFTFHQAGESKRNGHGCLPRGLRPNKISQGDNAPSRHLMTPSKISSARNELEVGDGGERGRGGGGGGRRFDVK